MPDARTLFADGILDASVTYGVVRLTLAQSGPEGKPVPAGQLLVPLSQLGAFTKSLAALLQQIDTRVKEAQAQQPGGAPAPAADPRPAEAPPSVPGAFRFS